MAEGSSASTPGLDPRLALPPHTLLKSFMAFTPGLQELGLHCEGTWQTEVTRNGRE